VRDTPAALSVPETRNQVWSMDFMHDALGDGRSFRLFNVLDDFNREALAIEADLSLPSARVIRALDQVIEWRGKPRVIRCDNGREYVSGTLLQWAAQHQIRIEHIQPGKPQQNAYVERFNRTVRYDWLAQHIFESITQVQDAATRWRIGSWHPWLHDRSRMSREAHVRFWEGAGLQCPALLNYLHAYESVSAARYGIARYMQFFNTRRPHSALDRRTPDDVYFGSLPLAVAA